MNLIKEIYEEDIDINFRSMDYTDIKWMLRKAARSILTRNNEIALLYVSHKNYHKLPGGGVEHGENILEALKRELLEETGCIANIKSEIGMVIEYRYSMALLQMSFVYKSVLQEDTGKINLTEHEISLGFKLKWVKISDVLSLISQDTPQDQSGKFISKRDFEILNYYINSIN